ncbi:helix-turn-helix domain-containing protein [Enterobacteriaceae bacterium H16N7]|nr:helix-turn-helix domain-containing protein [Dryocola clanedunensis]
MNPNFPVKTLNQLRPLLVGFRKARGMTQKEVSEKLGVTQQTYARLEANPSASSIERLFRVFNVLGIEMVLVDESDSAGFAKEERQDYSDSPARREEW